MTNAIFNFNFPKGKNPGNAPAHLIGVYQIYCKANQKMYVGKAGGMEGFRKRWGGHRSLLRRGKHYSKHLQNAFNLYGESNFYFQILEICSTEDDLLVREWEWIEKLDALENGFNGIGFVVYAETVKSSPINVTAKPFELINPLGEIISGYNISKFARDNGLSPSGISSVLRGKNSHCQGYRSTNPEFHIKKKEYRILSIENELFVFSDISRFAKDHGLSYTGLSSVLRGIHSHNSGWHLENMSPRHENNFKLFLESLEKTNFTNEQNQKERNLSRSIKTVISPSGDLFKFTNIKTFCIDNFLNFQFFKKLISGELDEYQGWKVLNNPSKDTFFIKKVSMITGQVLDVFSSFSSAFESLGGLPRASVGNLYRCVDKTLRSCYGFHWMEAENFEDRDPVDLTIFLKKSKWDREVNEN